ncbi:Spo0E family sporulation regulatory protein-aspartic acid phosphatase [Neobacillus sp. D3-1R]|uniref:Spo0E family sporulation regulatory protein-aspartic acid phosphatase n=1 Tax=Neobacillus sp. D3-1R TaxID=3445778 RepID=UPI003F9EC93A
MNATINDNELLEQIDLLRMKMIEIGIEKGLNNIETISISMELDQLLFTYQSLSLVNRNLSE